MAPTCPRGVLILALLLGALVVPTACGDDSDDAPTTDAGAGTAVTTPEPTETQTASEVPSDDEGGSEGGEGGLDDTAPPPAEVQIERGVEAFLVSPDSDRVCRDLVTDELISQSYGNVSGCLQARPKPTLAKRAQIGQPKIDGNEATIVATPDGGLYDGIEVEFTFTQDGESWLIDAVAADVAVGP